MTAVVLALLTAISYGLSDFVAGMASRRVPSLRVAAVVQLTALAVLAASLPFAGGHPTHRALLWGSIGGVGAGVGSAALYRGLARGQMSVVGPISG
ncbi:MAG: EamA family transporter, partial [Acidimicrobiales bacterium]